MPTGQLHIDLDALVSNWRSLDQRSPSGCETAAVVKADAYGLGVAPVTRRLADEGVRSFFVVSPQEGTTLRRELGPAPRIFTLYGHMPGDTDALRQADLTPMLTSAEQVQRHLSTASDLAFGVQLDTGMSRVGLTGPEWRALRDTIVAAKPVLVMSHLASADEPDSPQSAEQLTRFIDMTAGLTVRKSLAATGGTLLGPDYHFDMVRPGIGLYGGLPFRDAKPVVKLSLPIVACFDLPAGASVGYGATWTADRATRIATVAGGYADGLFRALQPDLQFWSGDTPCPVRGRISMDLISVDIGHLDADPEALTVLGPHQGIEDLAARAGTIGYEILTSLGPRYRRSYSG